MRRRSAFSAAAVIVAIVALFGLNGGQALASHVSCGATITQDTTLDSDLIDCSGYYAIVIAGDDVTLDLNGHTIDGVGGFGTAIHVPSAGRATIENGTVRQFNIGIELGMFGAPGPGHHEIHGIDLEDNFIDFFTYASDNHVADNTSDGSLSFFESHRNLIEGNAAGISLLHGNDNEVHENVGGMFLREATRNHVADNTFVGTEDQYGLTLFNADANLIERNSTSRLRFGIFLEGFNGSDRNIIQKNTLTSYTGIFLFGGRENVIEKNSISGSGIAGIRMETSGARANLVQKNTITGKNLAIALDFGPSVNRITKNELFGNAIGVIFEHSVTANEVFGNHIHDNGSGVRIDEDASGNRVVSNVISANSFGIQVASEGTESSPADRNTLEANSVFGNAIDGIYVGSASTNTVVLRNSTSRNSDDGIDVDAPGATITGNTANLNGGLGIEAVPGVIDGGGNTAAGNGNPLQCTNVTCG